MSVVFENKMIKINTGHVSKPHVHRATSTIHCSFRYPLSVFKPILTIISADVSYTNNHQSFSLRVVPMTTIVNEAVHKAG